MASSPKKKLYLRLFMIPIRHKNASYYIAYTFLIALCILISTVIMIDQHETLKYYLDFYSTRDPTMSAKKGGMRNSSAGSNAFIKAVSILGERNSGTTWIYEHLNICFNHTLPVKRRLTRYKHWFQDENVDTGGIVDEKDTLVIAMFRNPFEWVEAMRKRPHHASEHLFLKWNEFVTKPWTMHRAGLDLEMDEEEKKNPHSCQEAFLYRDIISCHLRPHPKKHGKTYFSDHQPFYEMRDDGSGEPFDNILEMRAAKNLNFLSTKDFRFVKQLWIVHYEELLIGGTEELIRNIEVATGIKSSCSPSPPQKRKSRPIHGDEMKYLMEHLDWSAERVIGYTKTGMIKATSNSTIYKKFTAS